MFKRVYDDAYEFTGIYHINSDRASGSMHVDHRLYAKHNNIIEQPYNP